MRFIVEPLKEGYKTIQIRTTELENFYHCPYKYKFDEINYSNKDALRFWNNAHSVILSCLLNPNKTTEIMEAAHAMFWEEDMMLIRQYVDYLYKKYFSRYNIVMTETTMLVEIEAWNYLVIIEGTMDWVSYNPETGKFHLLDLKTSKYWRKEEDLPFKLQRIIYPFLFWADKVEMFDYLIFTKHKWRGETKWKAARDQLFDFTVDKDEVESFIRAVIMEYTSRLTQDVWDARQTNQCYYCKFGKENWTCPLKNVIDF